MRRKYILAILLAASQLAFFACSDKTNNDQPDNISESAPAAESETEVDYLSQLPEANFEGYSFNILTLSPEICVGIQSFYAEEENGEIINDTVYKRNAYVEEKYNIEIGCEESGSVVSTAIKLVESNDNTFDIFSDELKRCLANSTHGIFYNILDIDPIDLSKPWWYNDVAEIMTIKVKLYAAYSDINTQIKERIACEFVNLDIIGDYSLDNPYQLVSEGKWTLDAMNYMSKTVADDLDGDQRMTKADRFGYVVGIGSYNVLINGADCPLATRTADGYAELNYGNERFIAAAEKIAQLCNDKNSTVYLNDYAWGTDVFREGRALFHEGNLYIFSLLREYESSFGVLPVPKFDEAQENYRCMMNNSSLGISIPSCADNIERSGIIIEALNAYSYLTLKDAYYETVLKGKMARDTESEAMLDIITRSIVVDFGVINEDSWGTVITKWLDSIHSSGADNLASLSASVQSEFDARLQQIISAYEN